MACAFYGIDVRAYFLCRHRSRTACSGTFLKHFSDAYAHECGDTKIVARIRCGYRIAWKIVPLRCVAKICSTMFGRKCDNELIWRNSNLRQYPNRRSSWTHTIDTHTVHSQFSIGSILTSVPYLLCGCRWVSGLFALHTADVHIFDQTYLIQAYGEPKIVLHTRARKTQIAHRRQPTKARYELSTDEFIVTRTYAYSRIAGNMEQRLCAQHLPNGKSEQAIQIDVCWYCAWLCCNKYTRRSHDANVILTISMMFTLKLDGIAVAAFAAADVLEIYVNSLVQYSKQDGNDSLIGQSYSQHMIPRSTFLILSSRLGETMAKQFLYRIPNDCKKLSILIVQVFVVFFCFEPG